MIDELEDIPAFAKRLKTKFPEYADIDDVELVERTVRKHPVYAGQVKLPAEFSLLQTTTGYKNLDALYEKAGREHNVDPNLLIEQGRQETINFKPEVIYGRLNSPAGAQGAGQFMPGTAPLYGVTDRTDPIQSINGQAKYMRKLLDQFNGNEDLALAGYNAGEYRKSLANGQVPKIKETQDYVRLIGDGLKKAREKGLTLKNFYAPATEPNYVGYTGDETGGRTASPTFPNQQPVNVTPVPETSDTLNAQLMSVLDLKSPKSAILTTDVSGNAQVANSLAASSLIPVPQANGQMLWLNKKKAEKLGIKSPKQAANFVNKHGFASLIGKVADVGNATNAGPTVLTTDQNGTELAASITPTPTDAIKQAGIDQLSFPDSQSQIVDAEDVVAARAAETPIDVTKEFEVPPTPHPEGWQALDDPSALFPVTRTVQQKLAESKRAAKRPRTAKSGTVNFDVDPNDPGVKAALAALAADPNAKLVNQPLGGVEMKEVDTRDSQAVGNAFADVIKIPDEITTQEAAGDYALRYLKAKYPNGKFSGAFFPKDWNAGNPIGISYDTLTGAGVDIQSDIAQKVAENRVVNGKPDLNVGKNWVQEDAEWLNSNAGKALKYVNPLFDFLDDETKNTIASSAIGGAIGSGSRIGDAVAGVARWNPLFEIAKPLTGDLSVAMREMSKPGADLEFKTGDKSITSQMFKVAGAAPGDLSRLILLTRLGGGITGGSGVIVGMAADQGLQSAGRQESMGEVAKQTAKGAVIGTIFAAAPVIGKVAGSAVAGGKLAKEFSKEAFTATTIMGGTYATEKAFGSSDDQATHAAIINTLFHLTNAGVQLAGKSIRARDSRGRETNAYVDPDGNVRLLKGEIKKPDVEMFVETEKGADGVYRTKGDTSPDRVAEEPYAVGNRGNQIGTSREPAQLSEQNPYRIPEAKPEAVAKAAEDPRVQKLSTILANGEPMSLEELKKASRYSPENVSAAVDTLIQARIVEILPDNTVRLIGEAPDKANVNLFEKYTNPQSDVSAPSTSEKSVSAQTQNIDNTRSESGTTGVADPNWQPSGKTSEIVPKEYTDATTTADQSRSIGKQTIDGVEYERQSVIDIPKGKTGRVVFAEKEPAQDFHFGIVEAESLQPAHLNGVRNFKHFLPEAQPKNRTDAASKQASDKIGSNPDLAQVGDSPNAYSGAPIINARGEVIQGNNRSEGLKKHYSNGGTDYKTQLEATASQFGFTPEQIAGMKAPVLVRVLDTDDKDAIRLGNFGAADIESGGRQFVDPVTTSARISHTEKARMVDEIFKNVAEDETITEAIRNNRSAIKALLDPYLTDTQKQTLFNKDTNDFTPRGVKDIEAVFTHFLFDGGDVTLPDLFDGLPHNTRQGIIASLPKIFSSGQDNAITPELQNAILAANSYDESASTDWNAWLGQPNMLNGIAPADRYTPLEQEMAKRLLGLKPDPNVPGQYTQKTPSQKEIKDLFAEYATLVNGKQADMFSPVQEPVSKTEAIQQIFGVSHVERTANQTATDDSRSGSATGSETRVEAEKPATERTTDTERAPRPEERVEPTRTLDDLSPLERSALRREVAPKAHQGGGKLPSDAARAFGLSETELAKLPPLGEVGQYGQTSHLIKKALSNEESDELYNDFAKVFAPQELRDIDPEFPETLDRAGQAANIVDAIAQDMDYPRSSHMDADAWGGVLDKHGDKLGDDAINAILSALEHQERWHRNIIRFITDPELEPLKRRVYELGDIAGVEAFQNPRWGNIVPPEFDANAPSYDFKSDSKIKKEALRVGRKYGITESRGEGGLSDTVIKQTFLRAIRQVANEALDEGSGTGAQRAEDRSDTPSVETAKRLGDEEELNIQFGSNAFDQTDLFGNPLTPQTEQIGLFDMSEPAATPYKPLKSHDEIPEKTYQFLAELRDSENKTVAKHASALMSVAVDVERFPKRFADGAGIVEDGADALDLYSRAVHTKTNIEFMVRQMWLDQGIKISDRANNYATAMADGSFGRVLNSDLNGNVQLAAPKTAAEKGSQFDQLTPKALVKASRAEDSKIRSMYADASKLSAPAIVTQAQFDIEKGVLRPQNVAALFVLHEATRNIDKQKFGNVNFTGAYYDANAAAQFEAVLNNSVDNAMATGQIKVANALANIAKMVESATDPQHGDLTVAMDMPELPVKSRNTLQEELSHRNNKRSGVRETFIEIAATPSIQKGLADLGPGYARIGVTNAVDEIIAKSFRDDAEIELNSSADDIWGNLTEFWENATKAGIDLAEYEKQAGQISATGKRFERYGKGQRSQRDVTAQPEREAIRDIRAGDLSPARETGTGSGTATRTISEDDRFAQLRQTEFSAADRDEAAKLDDAFFLDQPQGETALAKRTPAEIAFAIPKYEDLFDDEAETKTAVQKAIALFYDGKRDVTLAEAAVNIVRTGYLAGFSVIKTNLLGNTVNIVAEQLSKPAMALADIANAKFNPKAKEMRYVPGLSLPDIMTGIFGNGGLIRNGLLGDKGLITGLINGVGEIEASRIDMSGAGAENPNFVRNTGVPVIDATIEATKRAVVAIDRPFKAFARTSEKRGLQRIAAKNYDKLVLGRKGMFDQHWRKTMKDFQRTPSVLIEDLAERYAETVTFQNPNAITDIYDAFKQMLIDEKAIEKMLPNGSQNRLAKLAGKGAYVAVNSAFPFVKTPTNIGIRTAEYMLPSGVIMAASKLYNIGQGFERRHWVEDVGNSRAAMIAKVASGRANEDKIFRAESKTILDGFKRRKDQRTDDWQAEIEALKNSQVFTDKAKREKIAAIKNKKAKWLETWKTKREAYIESRKEDFNDIDNRRRIADMQTRDEWAAEDVFSDVKFTAFENKAAAESAGRTGFGTIIGGLFLLGVIKGVIDAVGVTDYDDEKGKWYAKRDAGIPDSSVRIGNYRFPYYNDPFGKSLNIGVNLFEQFDRPGSNYNRAGAMTKRLGKDVLGLNPLTNGEFTKDDFNSWAGSKANSVTPIVNLKIVQELGEVIDDKPRKYWDEGFAAQYLIKVPGLRETLPVSTNFVGGEQERGDITRRFLRLIDPLKTVRERRSQKTLPKTPLDKKSN